MAKFAKFWGKNRKNSAIFNEKFEIREWSTLRELNNSNRIPRSCSGTFFLVAFFSAATRHAGVLSSSRLLRASSGHLFQMLSWPGSFLSMFFLVFRDSIPKWCKGVHFVDLGESFPMNIYLQNLASIQPKTSPEKFESLSSREFEFIK